MSNGGYPYWDSDNRYIVAGPGGKLTVWAAVYQLPDGSGNWQGRCYGNQPICPQALGPYGSATGVQLALEQHCQDVHYVIAPPLGPAPTLNTVSPVSANVGDPDTVIAVTGTGFLPGAVVYWLASLPLATTFVDSNDLTATLPAGQLTTSGPFTLYVINPDQQASGTLAFSVNPALSSIVPSTRSANGPTFTLTVNGTGFDSAPVIYFNGIAQTTTIVTAGTSLSCSINPPQNATAGSYPVYVLNANGTQSSPINFIAT